VERADQQRQTQLSKVTSDLAKVERDRVDLDSGIYKMPPAPVSRDRQGRPSVMGSDQLGRINAERDRLQQQADSLRNEMVRLSAAPPVPKVKSFTDSLNDLDQQVKRTMYPERRGRGEVPMPLTDPRKAGGIPAPPSASIDLLTKANENFSNSASQLNTGISSFQSVFSAVPQKLSDAGTQVGTSIQTSGTTAGSSIASAMVGAGDTAGAAIAAQIRAAASSISINVNNNAGGKQGNPGSMSGPT
jgi:hypothetical protein